MYRPHGGARQERLREEAQQTATALTAVRTQLGRKESECRAVAAKAEKDVRALNATIARQRTTVKSLKMQLARFGVVFQDTDEPSTDGASRPSTAAPLQVGYLAAFVHGGA
jgi:hypothetical protein